MRKIINGKMYNTETAKKVCYADIGGSGFDYCVEELYRKRTGEFFLYGRGGARSKYATYVDVNTWSGGEGFTPMTESEAKKWLEKHGDVDTYIEVFGEVEE